MEKLTNEKAEFLTLIGTLRSEIETLKSQNDKESDVDTFTDEISTLLAQITTSKYVNKSLKYQCEKPEVINIVYVEKETFMSQNTLLRDENITLKSQITELNTKISSLETKLSSLKK